MTNRAKYVLYIKNRHSLSNALSFLSVNNVSDDDVVLIKSGFFESELTGIRIISLFDFYPMIFLVKLGIKSSFLKKKVCNLFSKFVSFKLNKEFNGYSINFICANYLEYHVNNFFNRINNEKKLIIVDDGMVIFEVVDFFQKKEHEIAITNSNRFTNTVRGIVYYSSFPIATKIRSDDVLFRQSCKDWKNYSVNQDIVHFVSQPLISFKIIDESEFEAALKKVVSRFGGKSRIIYYPHRRETIKERRVVEKLKCIEIAESSEPYEDVLSASGTLPCSIITFYSSVIYTIYEACRIIDLYYIPISLNLDFENVSSIQRVYKVLENDSSLKALV